MVVIFAASHTTRRLPPHLAIIMQQLDSFMASLISLPSDVTMQHIMTFLSRADLVALAMTCTTMHKFFLKWFIFNGEQLDAQFQDERARLRVG